jgi:hypothetical protein
MPSIGGAENGAYFSYSLPKETTPTKIRNMIENVSENRVAPFEVIAGNRA